MKMEMELSAATDAGSVPGTGLALSADPARLCQQRHENKNELDAPQPARKKEASKGEEMRRDVEII